MIQKKKAAIIAALSIAALGTGYFTVQRMRVFAMVSKIIRAAKSYIGEREIQPNQGFVNTQFQAIMYNLGNWRPGFEWCACFARMIWLLVLTGKKHEVARKLLSPSSQATYTNFSKDSSGYFKVSDKPKPGAIIIWQSVKEPSKGHAGLFIARLGRNYITIEGNKGQKVSICNYTPEKMLKPSNVLKLRGFINIK